MNEELIVLSVNKYVNNNLKYDVIYNQNKKSLNFGHNLLPQLRQWIDKLGEESAKAQTLKQSITSFDKLVDDKNEDTIYLLIKYDTNFPDDSSAVGFVRFGIRNLWFADKDNTTLRQVHNCYCILDFYVRYQRRGFGHFLIGLVLKFVSKTAHQFAYDKPTKAMMTFLNKHFGLSGAIPQHNHFVISDKFNFN